MPEKDKETTESVPVKMVSLAEDDSHQPKGQQGQPVMLVDYSKLMTADVICIVAAVSVITPKLLEIKGFVKKTYTGLHTIMANG